jgi:ParB family chromosome partitioning protein
MAATKKKAATGTRTRRKKKAAEPASRGLGAAQLDAAVPPLAIQALRSSILEDGGSVLGVYRDPVGGNWQILAGLPIDKVQPTPFQRDLSETHVGRLAAVIDKLDRFLDPVIVVRSEDGTYWTPNGHHRTAALRRIGGKSVTALVLPDTDVAYRILALNTEKAHNLREKSLEVIRMARALAERGQRRETELVLEFEEAAFLTLGLCYEKRGRFSGGAYHSILKKVDGFLDLPLPKALAVREERAAKLLELDDAVVEAVAGLKERGFQSPYLKAFVVARVNYLRFVKGEMPSFDTALAKILASAGRFDVSKIKESQVAAAAGPPDE